MYHPTAESFYVQIVILRIKGCSRKSLPRRGWAITTFLPRREEVVIQQTVMFRGGGGGVKPHIFGVIFFENCCDECA